MKCEAVRPALSYLVDGQLALTEWAIVQAHLRECSECREERDRLQVRATARARVRRRGATVATVAAVVVILAVAGGGFYLYRGGFPDLRRPDGFRLPPWGTVPPPPRTATPAAPAPGPSAPVAPSPARPKAPVPPIPRVAAPPAADPLPRATRPAAPAEGSGDRMPTQARSSTMLNAPPGAEAMPTQGPARPRGR